MWKLCARTAWRENSSARPRITGHGGHRGRGDGLVALAVLA
jgi:hypothetical protein